MKAYVELTRFEIEECVMALESFLEHRGSRLEGEEPTPDQIKHLIGHLLRAQEEREWREKNQ